MKKIKWLGLLSTLCVMTSANATPPLPSGWYAEGNLGASKITNVTYVPGSSISSSGLGWNINGGYKFMPFFGAELGYTHYASASAKISGIKVATTSTLYSYDLAGKGILPIGETGFELFAKLGVARLNSNVKSTNAAISHGIVVNTGSNSTTGYYFGLGGDYSFMPAVAVNAQWQMAKGNSKTGNMNLYSLGISYLFG